MPARKVLYIALAVTLTLWVGVGVYYLYTERFVKKAPKEEAAPQEETPTVTKFTPKDPYADWLFYKNEEFGWQLRYPEEFTSRDQGSIGTTTLNLTNFVIIEEGKPYPIVGVKVVTTPFEELKASVEKLSGAGFDVQETSVGGAQCVKMSGEKKDTGERRDEVICPSPDGKYTFRISCTTEARHIDYLELYEQMLESFTFL